MESTQNNMLLVEKVKSARKSTLYRVPGTNQVAKVRKDGDEVIITKEYVIAWELYKASVRVAKPIGLVRVLILNDNNELVEKPAFIQEELPGVSIEEMMEKGLIRKLQEHIYGLRNKEVKKAKNLGFIPGDADHEGNTIYDPNKGTVSLVDFEYWSKK